MATTRIKVSFDAEVARELRRVAGPRGLSRLVNEAVRRHLQAIRLREAAAEPATPAPIAEDAARRSAASDEQRSLGG